MTNEATATDATATDANYIHHGDWRWYVASESSTEATIKSGMEWIGQVKREHAAIIVRDHRAVPLLVKALEAAMKIVSDRAAGGRMLTTADEANRTWKLCQAALATAARVNRREGHR